MPAANPANAAAACVTSSTRTLFMQLGRAAARALTPAAARRSEPEVDPAQVAVHLELVVAHPLGEEAEVGVEHETRAQAVGGPALLGGGVGRGDLPEVGV